MKHFKSLDAISWSIRLLRRVARNGCPRHFFSFPGGIGDDLLCTAPIRELAARQRGETWMLTDYPELFLGNPDVALTVRKNSNWTQRSLKPLGIRSRALNYTTHIDGKDSPPARHIITEMCARAGVSGAIDRRPYLFLQKEESSQGIYGRRQVAIQSSAQSAKYPIRTKEWYPNRFQDVVQAFRNEYTFVQVGSPADPSLRGTIDLRGKCSIRETAAVMYNSIAFVGLVGFLMHLARSVECRSIIVYGGREHPQQSGYSCNENLVNQPTCSPCWAYACDHGMECMDAVKASNVIAAMERQISKHGAPLELDRDTIP